MLAEKITGDLADIDAQVANIRTAAKEQVAALLAKKAALIQVQPLITPELEAAVVALQGFGFLRTL